MQSEALTLYKLIILSILDKVNFPLTNAQVSDFILDKEYTDYFTIQQVISELYDSDLIHISSIRNSTYYRISSSGKETLSFFENKIPEAIQSDIEYFLQTNGYELREEVSTIADYFENKKDEYIVRCQVKEGGSPIIDLSLSLPSEEDASIMCNNWKSKSQEIYAHIMKTLLSQDSKNLD